LHRLNYLSRDALLRQIDDVVCGEWTGDSRRLHVAGNHSWIDPRFGHRHHFFRRGRSGGDLSAHVGRNFRAVPGGGFVHLRTEYAPANRAKASTDGRPRQRIARLASDQRSGTRSQQTTCRRSAVSVVWRLTAGGKSNWSNE
jgi:hypothetical protein